VVMEVADLDVFMYSVSSEQPSYYIASWFIFDVCTKGEMS
jgi:hypothetical protein